MRIRWMIRRDLPEVLDIEKASFEFPWSKNDFISQMKRRNVIGMVAEDEDRIVGYVIYELSKKHITLTNLAVSPLHRRKGVASEVIKKMKAKLSKDRRTRIELVIRETNYAGLNFFKAHGFKATGLVRGWFEDFTDEDGYEMEFNLLRSDHQSTNRISATGVEFDDAN